MYKFKKILLIEDDLITVIVCEKIISHVQFSETIVTASNGKEGIEYIKKCITENIDLPEVIFLDLNMPVMNGWDFLDEYSILHLPEKKSIVSILSSTIDILDEEKAYSYPVVSKFISKPLTKEILANFDNQ